MQMSSPLPFFPQNRRNEVVPPSLLFIDLLFSHKHFLLFHQSRSAPKCPKTNGDTDKANQIDDRFQQEKQHNIIDAEPYI